MWAAIAQSVQWIATGWAVWGSNPFRDEIFLTRPDQPWGSPSLLYNGYLVSFPGVKRPKRGLNHLPQSSAEVKERKELYFYSPSGPLRSVIRRTLPLIHTHTHGYIYIYVCKFKLDATNVPYSAVTKYTCLSFFLNTLYLLMLYYTQWVKEGILKFGLFAFRVWFKLKKYWSKWSFFFV